MYEECRKYRLGRFREGYKLCDTIANSIRAGGLDAPGLTADALNSLRCFKILFAVAARDMARAQEGYIIPNRQAEVSDWFEVARQRAVGTSQETNHGDRGKDEPGQDGIQPVPGKAYGGTFAESGLLQPGDEPGTDT